MPLKDILNEIKEASTQQHFDRGVKKAGEVLSNIKEKVSSERYKNLRELITVTNPMYLLNKFTEDPKEAFKSVFRTGVSSAVGIAEGATAGWFPDEKIEQMLEESTGITINPLTKGTSEFIGSFGAFKVIGAGLRFVPGLTKFMAAPTKDMGAVRRVLKLGNDLSAEIGAYNLLKQQDTDLIGRMGSGIEGAIVGKGLGLGISALGALTGGVSKVISKFEKSKIKNEFVFPQKIDELKKLIKMPDATFDKAVFKISGGRTKDLFKLEPAELLETQNYLLRKAAPKVNNMVWNDLAKQSSKNIVRSKTPTDPNATDLLKVIKDYDTSAISLERIANDLDGGVEGINTMVWQSIKNSRVDGYVAGTVVKANLATKHAGAISKAEDVLFKSKKIGDVKVKDAVHTYVGSLESPIYPEEVFNSVKEVQKKLGNVTIKKMLQTIKSQQNAIKLDRKILSKPDLTTDQAIFARESMKRAFNDIKNIRATLGTQPNVVRNIMRLRYNNVHLEKLHNGNGYSAEEINNMLAYVEQNTDIKAVATDMTKDYALAGRTAILKHNQHSDIKIKREVKNWLHVRSKDVGDKTPKSFTEQLFDFTTGKSKLPSQLKSRTGDLKTAESTDAFSNYERTMDDLYNYIYNIDTMMGITTYVNNPLFKKAVKSRHGEFVYDAIREHITSIYDSGYGASRGVVDNAAKWLRNRTIDVGLIGNIASVMRQPVSLLHAAGEVGLPPMIKEMTLYLKNPEAYRAEVNRLSKFMPTRRFSQELLDRAKIKGYNIGQLKKGFDRKAEDFLRAGDEFGAYTSWMGKFKKVMRTAKSVKEGVRLADQFVRRTQPLGSMEDLPLLYKGSPLAKGLTLFQNQQGKDYAILTRDLTGRSPGKVTPYEFIRKVGYSVVVRQMVMRQINRGGQDIADLVNAKDNTERAMIVKDMVKDVALSPLRYFPILGGTTSDIIQGFGGESAIEGYRGTLKALLTGDTRNKVRAGLQLGALAKGVKGGRQILRTGEGALDFLAGETRDLRRLVLSEFAVQPNKKITKKREEEEKELNTWLGIPPEED